jgi:hypothetical protein
VSRFGFVVGVGIMAVTFGLVGTAWADADPASDVLYVNNVFLPLSTRVSPLLARELAEATRAASDAGKPVRVALIAAPTDLGGVPALFGKPTDYARFLATELQFVYTGKLLIVMPQGAALASHGRLDANEFVIRAEVGSGGDGLARTAIALVRELSGQTAKSAPTPPAATAEDRSSPAARAPAAPAKGFPVWKSTVIAVGAVSVFLLIGLVLVRRRLRAQELEQVTGTAETLPERRDPCYRNPL